MKDYQNISPALKDNFFINKYPQNRITIIHENFKYFYKIPKRNIA